VSVVWIDRAVVLYNIETFEERQSTVLYVCVWHIFVSVCLIVTQGVLLSIAQNVSVSFGLITTLISFCRVRDNAVLMSRHFSNMQLLRCHSLPFSVVRPFANVFVARLLIFVINRLTVRDFLNICRTRVHFPC